MIAFTNNKIPTPHKKLSPKRQKGKYHPEDKPIKSSISLTNITHLFNLVCSEAHSILSAQVRRHSSDILQVISLV